MSEEQELTREVYVNGVSVEMTRFQIQEAIDDLQSALDSINEELNDDIAERNAP